MTRRPNFGLGEVAVLFPYGTLFWHCTALVQQNDHFWMMSKSDLANDQMAKVNNRSQSESKEKDALRENAPSSSKMSSPKAATTLS